MMLLTKKHRERLLRNGRNRDQDPAPVVKLFNPCGAATWLLDELNPEDGDTLFGLADLGFGTPELGDSSLAERAAVRVRWDLKLDRDQPLRAKYPMSVYTKAAGVDTSPCAGVTATAAARAA